MARPGVAGTTAHRRNAGMQEKSLPGVTSAAVPIHKETQYQ
jgi:hypothetical protein